MWTASLCVILAWQPVEGRSGLSDTPATWTDPFGMTLVLAHVKTRNMRISMPITLTVDLGMTRGQHRVDLRSGDIGTQDMSMEEHRLTRLDWPPV